MTLARGFLVGVFVKPKFDTDQSCGHTMYLGSVFIAPLLDRNLVVKGHPQEAAAATRMQCSNRLSTPSTFSLPCQGADSALFPPRKTAQQPYLVPLGAFITKCLTDRVVPASIQISRELADPSQIGGRGSPPPTFR